MSEWLFKKDPISRFRTVFDPLAEAAAWFLLSLAFLQAYYDLLHGPDQHYANLAYVLMAFVYVFWTLWKAAPQAAKKYGAACALTFIGIPAVGAWSMMLLHPDTLQDSMFVHNFSQYINLAAYLYGLGLFGYGIYRILLQARHRDRLFLQSSLRLVIASVFVLSIPFLTSVSQC